MLYTSYTYHIRSNYFAVTVIAQMYFKIYTIQYLVGPNMLGSICNIFQIFSTSSTLRFIIVLFGNTCNSLILSTVFNLFQLIQLISFHNSLSSLISVWNQHGNVYDLFILPVKFPSLWDYSHTHIHFSASHLQRKKNPVDNMMISVLWS